MLLAMGLALSQLVILGLGFWGLVPPGLLVYTPVVGGSLALALVLALWIARTRAVAGFGCLAGALTRLADPNAKDEEPQNYLVDAEFAKGIVDLAVSGASLRGALRDMEGKAERRSADLSAAYNELQTQNENVHRQMCMAQRVQSMFIPDLARMQKRPEIAFGAYYVAMDNVGGDLFDIIRVGKNAYGLLVVDVSGHGLAAALVTALVKISFQHSTGWGIPPSQTLLKVNEELKRTIAESEMFVTGFYVVVNIEAGTIEYANAGHHPAILFNRTTGAIEKLDADGPFLGVFDDAEYRMGTRALSEGDRIVLYTDGIVESRNFLKEEYDISRLVACIEGNPAISPDDLVAKIVRDIDSFTMGAPRRDDQTILVFDFDGPAVHFGEAKPALAETPADKADASVSSPASTEPAALLRQAVGMAGRGDHAQAEKILRRVLVLNPYDPVVLNNLGVVLVKLSRRDEAKVCFEQAVAAAPENPRYARNLATCTKKS